MILAHVSDLHALHVRGLRFVDLLSHKRLGGAANLLLRRRNKHPVALFEALVADLNLVAPDHVAVTGDLTNKKQYESRIPAALKDDALASELIGHHVAITGTTSSTSIWTVIGGLLPFIVLFRRRFRITEASA